ncbi:hypothetical protein LguiA_005772 [Lonicera macranthoides]
MLVEKEIAGRDLQEQITGKTDLQEEVIVEILSRLPVKSLLKFKSVCKGWYEIIKNPYLINKHLHNHYENDNGHLLVQRFIPESQLYGFESFTDKTLANLDQIVVDLYLQNTAVQGNSSPSLPSHPITVQLRVEDVYLSPPVLGFRHDPSANDYKVGWFLLKDIVVTKTTFLLYTLSNDSWRELNIDGLLSSPNVCFYSSLSNSNTYWNGFYYWQVSSYDYERGVSYKICGLDIVNEVFSEVQGPPSPFLHLTLYKGRIATCSPMWNGQIANSYSYAEINVNIEIWVMESGGNWTKQLIFGPFPNCGEFLGCWINGGIFFKTKAINSRLILCNPDQQLTDLGPRGLSHVYIHKESLVTLKGGNGSSKEDVSTNLVAPIRIFFNLCPRRSCIYGEGLEKLIS